MIWRVIFAIVVFLLGIVTLLSAAVCEKMWYKAGISVIFSAIVTMLVTFNIFR